MNEIIFVTCTILDPGVLFFPDVLFWTRVCEIIFVTCVIFARVVFLDTCAANNFYKSHGSISKLRSHG